MSPLPQIHSIPARGTAVHCRPVTAPVHPRLRPYLLGYGGFGSPGAPRIGHRLLPLALTVVVIDLDDGTGVISGVRDQAVVEERRRWGHGVTIALRPAGVAALLGTDHRALAGQLLDLDDLPATRDLAARLAPDPSWSRLDDVLLAALREPRAHPHELIAAAAVTPLQRPGAAIGRVAAELGVSRRLLEKACRERLGQSPATIARIARFQRATGLLATGARPADAGAEAGFADQPHLTREVRALCGLTPGQLCAILQDPAGVRH